MSNIPTRQIDGDVAVGRNVTAGGNAEVQGSVRIGHDLVVEGWLEADNIKSTNKGLFSTYAKLEDAYPQPHKGWFAGVLATDATLASLGITPQSGVGYFRMYTAENGGWVAMNKLYTITMDDQVYRALNANVTTLNGNVTALTQKYESVNFWEELALGTALDLWEPESEPPTDDVIEKRVVLARVYKENGAWKTDARGYLRFVLTFRLAANTGVLYTLKPGVAWGRVDYTDPESGALKHMEASGYFGTLGTQTIGAVPHAGKPYYNITTGRSIIFGGGYDVRRLADLLSLAEMRTEMNAVAAPIRADLNALGENVENFAPVFEELQTDVEGLHSSKAEQSDLLSVRASVNSLSNSVVTKSDLAGLHEALSQVTLVKGIVGTFNEIASNGLWYLNPTSASQAMNRGLWNVTGWDDEGEVRPTDWKTRVEIPAGGKFIKIENGDDTLYFIKSGLNKITYGDSVSADLSALTNRVTAAEGNITTLQGVDAAFDSAIQSVTIQAQTNKEDIEVHTADIADLKNRAENHDMISAVVRANEENIETLQTEMAGKMAMYDAVATTLGNLNTTMSSVEDGTIIMLTDQGYCIKKGAGNFSESCILRYKVTGVTGLPYRYWLYYAPDNVNYSLVELALDGRVTSALALKADASVVSALADRVATAEGNITTLQGVDAAFDSAIQSVTIQAQTNKEDIEIHRQDIADLKNKAENHDMISAVVRANEENIESLQTEMAGKVKILPFEYIFTNTAYAPISPEGEGSIGFATAFGCFYQYTDSAWVPMSVESVYNTFVDSNVRVNPANLYLQTKSKKLYFSWNSNLIELATQQDVNDALCMFFDLNGLVATQQEQIDGLIDSYDFDDVRIFAHDGSIYQLIPVKHWVNTPAMQNAYSAHGVAIMTTGRILVVALNDVPEEMSIITDLDAFDSSRFVEFNRYDRSQFVQDMDGKGNTQYLASTGVSPAAEYCLAYSPLADNATAAQWWIPSFGEVCVIASKITNVNRVLSILGGTQIHIGREMYSSTVTSNGPVGCDMTCRAYGLTTGTTSRIRFVTSI